MFYDKKYYETHYGRYLSNPQFYHLKSLFWKWNIFESNGISCDGKLLDYGCGLGQITSAIESVEYFDISEFAVDWLRSNGKKAHINDESIGREQFDGLLSSHSLEHSLNPYQDLKNFRDYVVEGGLLIIVLPVEFRTQPTLQQDNDRHMQTWTFQNITNMLHAAGWKPIKQRHIFDSYGLDKLGKLLPEEKAVRASWFLGRHFRKYYKSMLIISEKV